MGMCLVMSRKRCTSTVAPVFSAKAVCTFSLVSCLLRILLRNNVGWSVSRPLCDPTLSGPFPVTVVRPCMSLYVVLQPAFLMSVDEVVRIVFLISVSVSVW